MYGKRAWCGVFGRAIERVAIAKEGCFEVCLYGRLLWTYRQKPKSAIPKSTN